jgi:hypothetical protein
LVGARKRQHRTSLLAWRCIGDRFVNDKGLAFGRIRLNELFYVGEIRNIRVIFED